MNQHRLWSDPKVRAKRQAAAEERMGRPMELPPLRVVTADEARCPFCRCPATPIRAKETRA